MDGMKRENSRGRLLGKGLACLAAAFSLGACLPEEAWGIDRIAVIYGLREYAEYNDNLFNASEGGGSEKIDEISINTAPDISILYDDGETRWLARGSYRRESFPDDPEASGNFGSVSGEISRVLNQRVTFSLLGSYSRFDALELGRVLTEPGQQAVVRPIRGASTTGTFLSPSLTVFWSRRFQTTLSYEHNEGKTSGSFKSIDRSVSLSGVYALTPRSTLNGLLLAQTNRNSGLPFIDRQDVDTVVARFGFNRVFTPKLTINLSAGPQWTKNINLPDKVTLLRNALVEEVVDPVFGLTELAFLKEPGTEVDDLSLSLSLNLQIAYQMNRDTSMSLLLSQGTTSGAGAAGTQETRNVVFNVTRTLNSDWSASLRAGWTQRQSIPTDIAVLVAKDADTGETLALDRNSFGLSDRFEQQQLTVESRLSYRINQWMSAYASWNWTEFKQVSLGARTRVNRVQLGLEFRRDAFY